ncbi:MAG: leucine-rich repeat domain-containing protein [Lachnospiraceae bacterium]|nr:leucine-rich repeat domain-containing protein [Lachnospiraceae bacterium]
MKTTKMRFFEKAGRSSVAMMLSMLLLLSGVFTVVDFSEVKASSPPPHGYWSTTISDNAVADEISYWEIDPYTGALTFRALNESEKDDFDNGTLVCSQRYDEPYVAAAKAEGVSINSITITGGIKTIPTGAFAKSSQNDAEVFANLTTADIGDCVEEIGADAFSEEDNLLRVTLPSNLKKIGQGAFYLCTSLTSDTGVLTIPDSVNYMQACNTNVGTFTGTAFTKVVIGENSELEWIYNSCFSNMPMLTDLEIKGKKLKYIDTNAFAGNIVLSSVTLPENLLAIGGGAFLDNAALKDITLPSKLRYIDFPYDQTSSGYGAFQGTGLTSVTIPASVRYIGNHAFACCEKLESFTIEKGDEDVLIGLPNTYHSAVAPDVVGNRLSEDGNTLYDAYNSLDLTLYNKVDWITVDQNASIASAAKISDDDVEWPNKIIETGGAGGTFLNCTKLEEMIIPSNVLYVTNDFLRTSPDQGADVSVSCLSGSAAHEAVNDYNSHLYDRNVIADLIDKPIITLSENSITLDGGEVWTGANRENIGFSPLYDKADDAREALSYTTGNADIVTIDDDGNLHAQDLDRERYTTVTVTNTLTGASTFFTVTVKKSNNSQPSYKYKALTKAPLTWKLLDEGKKDYSKAGTKTLTASMMYKPYVNSNDGASGDTYGLLYEDRVSMNTEKKNLLPAGYDTLIEYGINVQTSTKNSVTGSIELGVPAAYAADSAKVVEVSQGAGATVKSAGNGSATFGLTIPISNEYADMLFIVAYKKTGSGGQQDTDSGKTDTTETLPKKGSKQEASDGKTSYEVTKSETGGVEVALSAPTSSQAKKTSVTIPAEVTLKDGTKAKVTSVKAKAYKGNKKVKRVVVGKNVKSIGKEAFTGCPKLKTLTFKSANLNLGKNALKNLNKGKKVTVYVPKSLKGKALKTFKNKLKKAGLKKFSVKKK